MASPRPLILIIGAGLNTGLSVAKRFSAQGWRVACMTRTDKPEFTPYQSLFVRADLTDPSTVSEAFQQVRTKLGIPNVVVYSAYAGTWGATPGDFFSDVSVEAYSTDLQVNASSNFAAVKCAVEGFKKLPQDATKAYIYIGNMCTSTITPEAITLGAGKNTALYTIENAAAVYGNLARWYYPDERDANGNPRAQKISGDAHADLFWDLANDPTQREMNHTFVKGKGYRRFEVLPSRPVHSMPQLMEVAEAYSG